MEMRSLIGWGQWSGTEWITRPETATQIRVNTIFGPWLGYVEKYSITYTKPPGMTSEAPTVFFSARHIFRLTILSSILTPLSNESNVPATNNKYQ